TNERKDLGRISKSIVYAIKAKVLLTAASPLFNGNNDYNGFQNTNGANPFNVKEDPTKWDRAARAAKEAVEFLEGQNYSLYEYRPTATNPNIDDTTKLRMTIRNSFAGSRNLEKPGVIWTRPDQGNYAGNNYYAQAYSTPRGLENSNPADESPLPRFSPTLQTVEIFYTDKGVPIGQDKNWDYSERYKTQK